MAQKLDEQPSQDGVYDDGKPSWRHEPNGDDPEQAYNAPAATDDDLPEGHPSRSDNKLGSGSDAKVSDPESLAQQESSGETPSGASAESKEQSSLEDADSQIGDGFKGEKAGGLRKITGRFSRRQKLIGGGVTGLVVGGGFGLFTFFSGPAQLLQLDFALGKHESGQNLTVASRIKRMFYRSAVQRNPDSRLTSGRTRLGAFSNRAFSGVLDRLEANQGVKFLGGEGTFSGTPRLMSINSLRGSPLLVAGDVDATRINIAREFGVDPSRVTVIPNGSGGSIRLVGLSSKQLDGVVDGLARKSGGGRFTSRLNPRITTAINKRMWRKTLNAPSLFHPISRVSARAGRAVDNFVLARRARKQTDAERSRRSARIDERESTARRVIRSKIGGGTIKIAGGAIALQGIMCTVKDLAGILPGAFYATTVMPAIIRTLQFQSTASQLRAGQDFNIEQMGDMVSDLQDAQGGTVWQAKSLNALASGGEGQGEDIDDGAKMAFATQGSSISGLYSLVEGEDPNNAGESTVDSVAGWACSTPARWLGLIGGVALAGVSFVGCGATAGASCAGTAARVGTQAAVGIAVFSVVSRMLGEFVADTASGKVADACGIEINPSEDDGGEKIDTLNAKAFGNCLAYASRMENNISGASKGFVPLSSDDELAVIREANEQDLAEFKKKGLAERLFSTQNERSLAMSMFRKSSDMGITSGSSSQIASVFLKVPFIIADGFSSVFSNTTHAQAVSYDWGFPAFGLPLSITEDPKYADPVANANWILEHRDDLDDGRIEECFGVKLVDGSEGLQADLLEDEVNPLSDDYNDKNCGDLSNETWVRTALFVTDDSIARSLDCYDGYGNSCQEIGFGGVAQTTAGPTPSPTPTTGQTIVGDIGESSDTVACAPGTTDLGVATSKYTGSAKKTSGSLLIRLCQLSSVGGRGNNVSGVNISGGAVLNSRVSGAWQALGEAAKAAGVPLTASSSFRLADSCGGTGDGGACARPGKSLHQLGVAIDFVGDIKKIYGASRESCSGRARDPSSQAWNWLFTNAEKYGFKQYSYEAWHWDPLNSASRCGATQ